jgi:serine/threonine protein kinase
MNDSPERRSLSVPRSTPNLPSYLWHHRVHMEKAKESLYFYRLSFDPVYNRDGVKAAIDLACKKHGVTGRIIYELLGVYDVLLRIWLPNACRFDDFHRSLASELQDAGLEMLDPFEVDYMIRHWPFFKEGKQQTPEEAAIHKLKPATIERIDNGEISSLDSKQVEWLESNKLLARTDGSVGEPRNAKPGIKFMTIIRGSDRLSSDEMEAFETKIVEILDEAKTLNQRSMYSGSGFGHFLIMGRADYDQDSFHAIQSQLIAPLNAADVREQFGTRTVTHLGGQRGYSVVEERLSGAKEKASPMSVQGVAEVEEREVLVPGVVYAERFEIKETLGDGGYADVFRVFDRYERVERALKVFKSKDPQVALREIAALRKISHPNVVKLFWGDRYESSWFMVCELIRGKPLNRIDDLDAVRSLTIMIQVLTALEAVHPADDRIAELRELRKGEMEPAQLAELLELEATGLIHRDIKPQNIMVGDDDRVVLVDFNIASPARDATTTTSGTPPYFAPDAGFDYWDPADDLFACGVVLYGLLTGAHPYPKEQPVARVEPTDPRKYVPSLRPSIAELLIKACSPLRRDRHRTAKEMRDELEEELRVLKTDTRTNQIVRSLRERRHELGLSVKELSRATGVDAGRLARIERSDTEPKLNELLSVGEGLKMTKSLLEEINDIPVRDLDPEPGSGDSGRRKPPHDPEDEPPPDHEDEEEEDGCDGIKRDEDDDLPALDPV